MATTYENYCDSWVVPSGTYTAEGNSYAGAFYRLWWNTTVVSPGVTRVDWAVQGRGRTGASPTWLNNSCTISINGGVGQIYNLTLEKNGLNGVNTSFNHTADVSWRTSNPAGSGSFTINHDSANAIDLTVTLTVSIYEASVVKTVTRTMTIPANSPAAANIFVDGEWKAAVPHVYHDGEWVIATPYIWNGSEWKIAKT